MMMEEMEWPSAVVQEMTEDVSVVLENLMLYGAGGIPESKHKHTQNIGVYIHLFLLSALSQTLSSVLLLC